MLNLVTIALIGFFGLTTEEAPAEPMEKKEIYVSAQKITITSASYGLNCNGRKIGGNFGIQDNTVYDVKENNVLADLGKGCNGKKACRFMVNADLFGDPAPKCTKNLEIGFTCTQLESPRTYLQKEGEEAFIDCRTDLERKQDAEAKAEEERRRAKR